MWIFRLEIPDTAYDFYDDQEEQQNMGKLMAELNQNQTTTSPVVAGSIDYATPNDAENGITIQNDHILFFN